MLIATFSGLRWTHNAGSLNDVRRYVTAFTKELPGFVKTASSDTLKHERTVVVGRDGRETGLSYPKAVIGTLLLAGYDVLYCDTVPTPTIQQLVKLRGCAGGVIMTASHNPPEWNGLKFVGPTSIFLTPAECSAVYSHSVVSMVIDDKANFNTLYAQQCDELEQHIDNFLGSAQNIGKGYTHGDATLRFLGTDAAIVEHVDNVLGLRSLFDVEAIRKAGLRITFSGCNAAGATYIGYLCKRLGVELVQPYSMTIGKLPAHPEPIPQNLQEFSEHCKTIGGLDLAFAVDPDADRLVVLDESGTPVGEDLTLAMAVAYVLQKLSDRVLQQEECFVVTNVSTSLVVQDACNSFNRQHRKDVCHCVGAAVGEVNVALQMEEYADRCFIGGEGNGGVMLPAAHVGRDSIVAIVCVLSWVVASRSVLPASSNPESRQVSSILTDTFSKYAIRKAKYVFEPKARQSLQERIASIADAERTKKTLDVNTVDGVKLSDAASRCWVHLRFSNTEPVIRIIAEALTSDKTDELIAFYEHALGLSSS